MQHVFLFPVLTLEAKNESFYILDVFPRKVRNTTPDGTEPIFLQTHLRMCATRTRRLLASPDELRREAGDSVGFKHNTLSSKYPPFGEKPEEEWQRSLDRAQCIQVDDNCLTSEFLYARDPRWNDDDLEVWRNYKHTHHMRYRMGEYCRSNLDWDWDTASSLKRLFRTYRPTKFPRPDCSMQHVCSSLPAKPDLPVAMGNRADGRTLTVTTPERRPELLEKIRVRYETETGEVKYKTFYPRSTVEDVSTCSGPGKLFESAQITGELDTYTVHVPWRRNTDISEIYRIVDRCVE